MAATAINRVLRPAGMRVTEPLSTLSTRTPAADDLNFLASQL